MQESGNLSPIGDINMACHVYIIKTACMMLFGEARLLQCIVRIESGMRFVRIESGMRLQAEM